MLASDSWYWVGLGWVVLGQSADGLGWIGSHKMDPWTTLVSAHHTLIGVDKPLLSVTSPWRRRHVHVINFSNSMERCSAQSPASQAVRAYFSSAQYDRVRCRKKYRILSPCWTLKKCIRRMDVAYRRIETVLAQATSLLASISITAVRSK